MKVFLTDPSSPVLLVCSLRWTAVRVRQPSRNRPTRLSNGCPDGNSRGEKQSRVECVRNRFGLRRAAAVKVQTVMKLPDYGW